MRKDNDANHRQMSIVMAMNHGVEISNVNRIKGRSKSGIEQMRRTQSGISH